MFCGKCGTSILVDATFCTRCGSPFAVAHNFIQITATPIPTMRPIESGRGVVSVVGAVMYLLVVIGCFALYWNAVQGDWAGAVGYEIGLALFPTAIVLLYYKMRKQKASAARVVSALACWIVIANLVSISKARPQLTEADLQVIAKEASGVVPISNPNDAARTVIRDYFKETIAQNKDYYSKVDSLKYEGIYTPQSYLDPAEAKGIISQLDAGLEIEQSQEDALNSILARCKVKINSLDWTEAYKREFLKGVDAGNQKQQAFRRPLVSAEREWMTSVRDLYIFVLDNEQHFRRSGDSVVIVNTPVLDQFNRMIGQANELSKKYQAAQKTFEQDQDKRLSKLGVSTKDFGIAK